MIIKGKLIEKLPVQEGDSAKGHWQRGGFVLEYGDEFKRTAAFSCFGEDKVNAVGDMQDGIMVEVDFMPESREYNGRWYTDLKMRSVKPESVPTDVEPQQTYGQYTNVPPQPQAWPPKDDDLPF